MANILTLLSPDAEWPCLSLRKVVYRHYRRQVMLCLHFPEASITLSPKIKLIQTLLFVYFAKRSLGIQFISTSSYPRKIYDTVTYNESDRIHGRRRLRLPSLVSYLGFIPNIVSVSTRCLLVVFYFFVSFGLSGPAMMFLFRVSTFT